MNRNQFHSYLKKLGFPSGLLFKKGNGLCAQFDAKDRLVDLQWKENKQGVGRHLILHPGRKGGRLSWPHGAGGTEDYEIYKDGKWEQFNAWSDSSAPKAMLWSKWVENAVSRFLAGCSCLLCGLGLDKEPAAAHSSCKTRWTCAPCYKRIRKAEPSSRSWPLGNRYCAVCRKLHEESDRFFEGKRFKLCTACAAEFRPVRR